MFAIESLSLAGEHYDNSASVRKACEFLLSKQMADGGWGESYKVSKAILICCNVCLLLNVGSFRQSCETEQYVHHEKSQVVNTAWGERLVNSATLHSLLTLRLLQRCWHSFEPSTQIWNPSDEAANCSSRVSCLMGAGHRKASKGVSFLPFACHGRRFTVAHSLPSLQSSTRMRPSAVSS